MFTGTLFQKYLALAVVFIFINNWLDECYNIIKSQYFSVGKNWMSQY